MGRRIDVRRNEEEPTTAPAERATPAPDASLASAVGNQAFTRAVQSGAAAPVLARSGMTGALTDIAESAAGVAGAAAPASEAAPAVEGGSAAEPSGGSAPQGGVAGALGSMADGTQGAAAAAGQAADAPEPAPSPSAAQGGVAGALESVAEVAGNAAAAAQAGADAPMKDSDVADPALAKGNEPQFENAVGGESAEDAAGSVADAADDVW